MSLSIMAIFVTKIFIYKEDIIGIGMHDFSKIGTTCTHCYPFNFPRNKINLRSYVKSNPFSVKVLC
jgi:hypothetical protein